MRFIDKYYAEDTFRLNPCGKWCPYQLGYEEAPKKKDRCPEAVRGYACDECWKREMPESKSTELKSEPANANDFPGFEINDIVKLRSGRLCIVLPNNRSKDNKSICYTTYDSSTEYITDSGVRCLNYCSDYTGSIYKNCVDDVVKLWRATPENGLSLIGYFFNKKEIPYFIKPIWVEPTAKKMTLKEIEKELGYPVEIIPESESEGNES